MKYTVMEVNCDDSAYFRETPPGVQENHTHPVRTWDDREVAIQFANEQQALADAGGNAWNCTYHVYPYYEHIHREDPPVHVTQSLITRQCSTS